MTLYYLTLTVSYASLTLFATDALRSIIKE